MRRAMRLRPVDEANLVLDHAGQFNVFLAAGYLTADGFVGADGMPDLGKLRAVVAGRVAVLPSLRRVPVPSRHGHRWVEQDPDLSEHIRLLPAVAGLADLERRCGELMAVPLPRTRPLWEVLLALSSDGRQPAFIVRIHHAVADGMAAVEIIRRLLDPQPARASGGPVVPIREREAAALPRRALMHRAVFGLRRTVAMLSGGGFPSTILLGARSEFHGVAFVDADLRAIEAHAQRFGATVNDVLLTAAAAGYRAALVAAGEAVPAELPVSVPVALRRSGRANNAVGVMVVRLPLSTASVDDRLAAIAEQTRLEKAEARQQGTLEFMRGPIGARVMDQVARRQHVVAGFVTNVPGPNDPLRLAGAEVSRLWPVAGLAGNVRLGIAAVSYAGWLCCGIHFDRGYVDGGAVASAVQAELAVLSR